MSFSIPYKVTFLLSIYNPLVDRALEKFAEMMIEKISTLQSDWKKPWFTEGALTWPKNLSGREYNGILQAY